MSKQVDFIKAKLLKKGHPVCIGSDITGKMQFVSSGSLAINKLIGQPGYPCGLITEIWGPSSSGKSILTLKAEAVVTKRKRWCLHIDGERNYEHAETNKWRSDLGVDLNYVLQLSGDTAEKMMQATLDVVKDMGKHLELIVVDSVNSLVPEQVADKEMQESTVALTAKLLHAWFDKLRIFNKHSAFLAINQVTSRIGGYGNPVIKAGGYAMSFDPHLSLYVTGVPLLGKDSDVEGSIGNELTITIKKNKLSTQGKSCKVRFLRELGGFDILSEVIDEAAEKGIITRKIPYYYLGDKCVQGKEKLQDLLRRNPKVLANIITKLGYNPKDLGVEIVGEAG